jgi:hypothetical protein
VAKWWIAWEQNCWFVKLVVEMVCGSGLAVLGLTIV